MPHDAPAPRLSPGSRHAIPVRDPGLEFDAGIPRHWLAENPVATHFFNGLNLVFPDGERFFIRAVADHANEVRDPALREQARGFFGQEAKHAAVHERYFETLREQGYAIDGFLDRFRAFARWTMRRIPRRLRLAMTAGAEHWTAVFGAMALDDELLLRHAHPTMRNLIVWHATEEIEHKAVAYDVFEACYGRGPLAYLLRQAGYVLSTLILFSWTLVGTRMLIRQDGLSRGQRRAAHVALRRPEAGDNARRILRGALAYLRPGFHPNETDELPRAHALLDELGIGAGA